MRLATLSNLPFINGLCQRYFSVSLDDIVKNNGQDTALFDFINHLGPGRYSFLCHDKIAVERKEKGADGNEYTVISYTWVPWEAPQPSILPSGIIHNN